LLKVIENADGQFGGRTQRFLDPNDVVRGINAVFNKENIRQRAQWIPATTLQGDEAELIPNPLFEPGRPIDLEIESRWKDDRHRTEPKTEQAYFTGRDRAVRELTEWLAQPPDGHARVITGSLGTGKSALVRHIVLLSGAQVVLNARRQTLGDLRAMIGGVLGVDAATTKALVDHLLAQTHPVTIVVDALDEASEPRQIARDLLREIAAVPTVHLLVARRPEAPLEQGRRRVTSLGSTTVEIDLDDSHYLGDRDVEEYVVRWLLAELEPSRCTPYRDRADLARRVARLVAARAGLVFLVARIVARNLTERDTVIDPQDPAAHAGIPGEVDVAFEQFLDWFDVDTKTELSTAVVRAVLLPLAFAEGAGLPRADTWSAVATALAGKEYTDDDVTSAMLHAGAYIVESSERRRSVYREGCTNPGSPCPSGPGPTWADAGA
jgi:hypothetical protein